MKKCIIAAALVIALCMSMLAACAGNGTTPPAGGTATPGGGSNTPAGGNDAPVKVGILGPFTGEVAQYGIAVRNGAMLYIEQYNAAGGLNGKQIEPIEYDEEGDSIKALTGYNSLLDQGVTAIIGSVTSTPTIAVVPEAFADNMPMITASATASSVTYNDEEDVVYTNMFRSCFIDPFQGEKMADFAAGELNAQTAAVIFNTGDDYSIGLKDAFLEKAAAIGLEVVANEGYAKGAVDFQSQLTNIAAKKPDVLFCPDYYEVIALLSSQARAAGVSATLLGADGWDTVVKIMSDRAPVEGAYYCSGYSIEDTTPMVQEFLGDYQAKYGQEPSMFAAQGYDAAMILVAALEKAEAAGGQAGSDGYRTDVIAALKATDMECVTGHVTYDQYNNPVKSAVIINIYNGEAKFWGKY